MYQGGTTFLPLRVNQAGVIPIIFAVSILLFPSQIAGYFAQSKVSIVQQVATFFVNTFGPSNLIVYGSLYFLLTVGFTYFYTAFTFKPDETAEQLRKNGGFIPGIRPGRPTQDYLARVVNRITVAGALFLGVVAVMPYAFQAFIPGLAGTLPRWHEHPDRRVRGRRDDEAAGGSADDAELRGVHPVSADGSLR